MNESVSPLFTEELYSLKPGTTIVLTKPWAEVSAPETEQLAKMLNALKLTLDKVTVLYQPMLDLTLLTVKPEHLIYFGPPPTGIKYYEYTEREQVKLVASEELAVLIQDKAAKQKLWEALRQLFSL